MKSPSKNGKKCDIFGDGVREFVLGDKVATTGKHAFDGCYLTSSLHTP